MLVGIFTGLFKHMPKNMALLVKKKEEKKIPVVIKLEGGGGKAF